MVQAAKDGAFLLEQRKDRLIAGELRQHRLDGDRLAGLDVVAAIDLAHAAGRDALVDLIGVVQPDAGIERRRCSG